MRRIATESAITLGSATLAVFASRTPLHQYDLEIGAVLFIILFTLRLIGVGKGIFWHLLLAGGFSFISVFIVISTGGSISPYFFLFYFALFVSSLLLEPASSLIITLYLMILLTASLPQNQPYAKILPIISLGFISPFAILLGIEHESLIKEEKLMTSTEQKLNALVGKLRSASQQQPTEKTMIQIRTCINDLEESVKQLHDQPHA